MPDYPLLVTPLQPIIGLSVVFDDHQRGWEPLFQAQPNLNDERIEMEVTESTPVVAIVTAMKSDAGSYAMEWVAAWDTFVRTLEVGESPGVELANGTRFYRLIDATYVTYARTAANEVTVLTVGLLA